MFGSKGDPDSGAWGEEKVCEEEKKQKFQQGYLKVASGMIVVFVDNCCEICTEDVQSITWLL